jgi:hypothetical protein
MKMISVSRLRETGHESIRFLWYVQVPNPVLGWHTLIQCLESLMASPPETICQTYTPARLV